MFDFLSRLFDTSGFPPRWQCGDWTAGHGWLHILSDLGVWSAYVTIPCVLGYFVLRRKDIPFRGIFLLFGAFILACGTTHLMEVLMFWWPAYRLAGLIKLFTALVSWGTVLALVPVAPKVLAMRSPEDLEREIAARKEAENALLRVNAELERQVEALRSSEERFRLLVDGTKDYGIFMIDPTGRVASWNSGAERIKQYPASEIVGQHVSRFYPPEDVESGKPRKELQVAVAEGKYEEEGWRVRKDGSRFWASVVITALRDESGQLRGFGKVTRDVTERRRAEENARRLLQEEAARKAAEEFAQVIERQREQLRVTLTSIGDAVITTDAEGRVTLLNPVAQALSGWQEEALGRPLEEVFHIINEKTRQRADNPVSRVMREGTVVGLANHTALVAKDATVRPIEDSAAPIRDEHGQIFGVVLVFRDATERRTAEAAIRHSETALRAKQAELDLVISRTPLLLTRCSRDRRYLFANRAYAEFIGHPAEEIVGRPIVEVMGESAFATITPHVERVLRGEPVEFETEVDYASVGRRFMRALYTPDRDEHGDVIGWIATIIDITERKQLEREREERAAELAVALGKRTEEARRAEKAEGLLREADRRKDEFMAILAHELRNPLAPLRNALELLRLANDDKTLIDQARGIMARQLDHMVRLIDDLLDMSRISQGKVQVRREPVELAAALQSAVETIRPLLEAQSHSFSVTLPPQTIYLHADPARLTQVIANLLNNAAKFTEKGGHIWLTAERQGNEAVVSVRDTGIGIDAEHLPHLFEMFSQAAPALERSQGGLGIGLSLVRGLVELHGGHVEAHSGGLGKGSEFIVRLPVMDVPAERKLQEPAANLAVADVRKWRLLVVDDNQDAADSLAMMLRMMGHETRTAYDGAEAIEAAAAFRPEVVLLDIGLPKMNGYDVARRMRQCWGDGLALVALTGWGQEEDKQRALEAGFDHHLTKPVEATALEKLFALINAAQRH
jgi:PAS domain S-box-containing protein